MTLVERIWTGNELFRITEFVTIKGRKYARITASTNKDSMIMTFDIPQDASPYLREKDDDPKFLSDGHDSCLAIRDGYRIVEKNERLQQVYVGNVLIYDRIKHGF